MICLCLLFIQVAIGVLMSITYTIHRENPHTFDTSALHRVLSKQTKINPIYYRKLESQQTWVCIIKRGCVSCVHFISMNKKDISILNLYMI